MITGKILVELGYSPGKWFKPALEYLNNNNIPEDKITDHIEQFLPPPYLLPRETSLEYYKNIEAENDLELENLMAVEDTMNEVMKIPTVVSGAIMPDACPAGPLGHIPVGGVVVTDNAIHPSMHSADICCSVMMTGFGNIPPSRILDLVHKITDFGKGPRKNDIRFELPDDIYQDMKNNQYFSPQALAMARSHLGSQGDGNHFAFVGVSEQTRETCLVTHHGSRGVGAQVYKYGVAKAEKYRKEFSPTSSKINGWIPYNTSDGQEYWEALQIIRRWTKLNHLVLHQWIVDKVGYVSKTHFWNEHNFVFKKENLFYHAKGSTPLLDEFVPDNQTGLRLIPLNMKEPVLLVRGNITKQNLGFAPHGAGRNMSRTRFLNSGIDLSKEIEGLDVRFYHGTPDYSEFPSAYKNAQSIISQIEKFQMGEVIDKILPYGCIMAGG